MDATISFGNWIHLTDSERAHNKRHKAACYSTHGPIIAIVMTFITATPGEVMGAIGARLRVQRLAHALSQQELALMAGLSLGAVRKLERNGQSSVETLIRAAQALGLLAELDSLFLLKRESITDMVHTAQVQSRRRAPRRPRT